MIFKKIGSILLAGVFALMFVIPATAKVFTDVDSYSSFKEGGNPVFNFGDEIQDYWVGEWNGGMRLDEAQIEKANAKGWNGSTAIGLWEDGTTENQGMYLFATASNGISKDYSGAKYLRVWMDLSDVAFRKANFGVFDSKYNLFTTDEENSTVDSWPFYYLPEGGNTWETHYHGSDGCFGDAQDSDIKGFKGFFAFPVSDFVIRESANYDAFDKDTPANMSDVLGVYLFWDYSDEAVDLQGNKFYLDNIEFITDYKTFDDAIYAPPAEEAPQPKTIETVGIEEVQPIEAVTVADAPQTSDLTAIFITLASVSALIMVYFKTARRKFNG